MWHFDSCSVLESISDKLKIDFPVIVFVEFNSILRRE